MENLIFLWICILFKNGYLFRVMIYLNIDYV